MLLKFTTCKTQSEVFNFLLLKEVHQCAVVAVVTQDPWGRFERKHASRCD